MAVDLLANKMERNSQRKAVELNNAVHAISRTISKCVGLMQIVFMDFMERVTRCLSLNPIKTMNNHQATRVAFNGTFTYNVAGYLFNCAHSKATSVFYVLLAQFCMEINESRAQLKGNMAKS